MNDEGDVEKTTKRAHADKQTKAKRISIIYKQLLKGTRSIDIVDKYSNEWHVTERQIYLYINMAQERIDAISNRKQEELFNVHVALRQDLRNEAIEANDRRLAFDIMKDEAKLLNLYPEDSLKIQLPKEMEIRYINDWRAGENEAESLPAPADKNIIEGEVREIVEDEHK